MKPDDYRRLVAAGMTPDQIALVMEMFDAQDEDRKAQQRARWRKSQENKRNAHVSQRELTLANVPRAGVTRVEDKPLPTETDIHKPKKQNTAASGVVEFRAKLADHLDTDLLEAFVAVRKTKRGALSGYAAGLFVSDAAKCGMSVADAARECVRSSWITVKPEYFSGRPHSRAGPAQQAPSMSQILEVIRDQASADEPEHPEDRSSLRAAIPHLRAVGAG